MTRNSLTILLILFLTALCGQPLTSQNKDIEALRKQRKELQVLINLTSKQLKKTQKDERNSLKKLNTLQKNLAERKKLINNYTQEIKTIQRKIKTLQHEKKQLEEKLNHVKDDYTKLIQNTQHSQNRYNKLMFVLSAHNFNQTWRRIRYIQTFTKHREQQAKEIQKLTTDINLKNDSLIAHKTVQEEAKKAKQIETEKLIQAQKEEKKFLTNLQSREKELSTNFQAQQRQRDNIDKKINQVIAEEIRKEKERKRKIAARKQKKQQDNKKTATKQDNKTRQYTTPTEDNILTGGFANNKGKLPRPITQGYISSKFGKQTHPLFKHVKINNRGIYFQAPAGSNARAVFDGIVTRRFSLPGSGNAIIIQHGNYRTVYGNLTSIYVKEGDKIKAKQPIGRIYTDETTGNAELQFQLWHNSTLLNPETWIKK